MQLKRTRMPIAVALLAAALALPACASNKPNEAAAPVASGMEGGWRIQVGACTGTLVVTATVAANSQYVGDLSMACGKETSTQPVTVLTADTVVTVMPLPTTDAKAKKTKGWLTQPISLFKGENLIYGPQSAQKNAPVVAITR